MEMKNRSHVVMLAFPLMAHINPMIEFAKVLSGKGFYISFIITEYMHEKMLKSGSIQSMSDIALETIPDGLPPQHGRTSNLDEFTESIATKCPLHFEKVIEKLKSKEDVPPLSCIIYNGLMSWAQKSAKRFGIPGVYFWTASACGFNIYLTMPLLVKKGYIPIKDKSYLTNGYLEKEEISCIPAMPTMHVIDVPSFYYDGTKYVFKLLESQWQDAMLADFMVVNTFEELEGPILEIVQARVPVYSIGPLLLYAEAQTSEETSCIKWLDDQSAHYVIYVCFGTMALISEKELLELAWGLEVSKQPFLWAIRPDLIHGVSSVLHPEFLEKVKERGLLVWKIGIPLNADVTRGDVEEKVRRLMKGEEGEEMRKIAGEFREASIKAVKKGGSSYNNLEKIIAIMQVKDKI